MAFIKTIPPTEASDMLRDLYNAEVRQSGYVQNHTQALSQRPEFISAWRSMIAGLRARMNLRRYELITIAVVTGLKCTY